MSNSHHGVRSITAETRYALFLVQAGQGCDYTLGCGVALWGLQGTTPQAALQEVYGLLRGVPGAISPHLDTESEMLVEAAYIVNVVHPIDLRTLRLRYLQEREARESNTAEARERAEYERLHEKFGKR